jgi:hypothetical protein
MKSRLTLLVVATLLALPAMAEEHVGRNAERGDPARWSQPITSPRQKYENVLKESRAAYAEAMKDCRSQRGERKSCEAAARAQLQSDKDYARSFLDRSGPRG